MTLLARVETGEGTGGLAATADLPFQTVQLAGKELIRAGASVKVPFEVQLPWETPVTTVFGKYLTGMAVGLQTNLNLAGSRMSGGGLMFLAGELANPGGSSGIAKDCDSRDVRADLFKQLQPFRAHAVFELHEASGVAARP